MGGYERNPTPWTLDGRSRRLQPPAARGGLGAVRADRGGRVRPGPRARATPRSTRLINGPEAFTPDDEFILGETDVRGLLRARPASAPTGSPGPAGSAQSWPSGSSTASPSLDLWKMDVRRFGAHVPEPRGTRSRARTRSTRRTTTSTTRARSARPGRPLQISPTYARLRRSAPRSARSPAGSARTGSSRTRIRRSTTRCSRAGWAGEHWSTGDRRRARRDARERAALFDESSFAKLEVVGPAGVRFLQRICARTTSTAAGYGRSYTQMLNRRGGIECDLTVTRLAGRPLSDRHRDGVRQPRPRVDPSGTLGDADGSRSST